MNQLFSPLRLRDLTFRNRIFVSPMCQYSSDNGLATDWHLVHLGSRAVGGAALVMVEATAVSPEGRISPGDSGLWSPAHAQAFMRMTRFIKDQGAVPAVQLAHAGRKASTNLPWLGGEPLINGPESWQPVAPSALAFDSGYATPRQLSSADIDAVADQFAASARWALEAGFEVVELHMAHGYLMHEFLSPLSNHRTDDYGGPLANRMRLPLRIAAIVREIWPKSSPVFVRISATDWVEGGWDLGQSIQLARALRDLGIDLIDCSSGGLAPKAKVPAAPGYQVPFAQAIRKEANIATGAVGLITEARQAEKIIADGQADAVLLGRAMLADPYWPLHAAKALGVDVLWPRQYLRAKT
jgi:2,4-dienoyl-CoA reductase-like NADH-dependent reductase (Old Yellow Enzyme family)